VIWEPWTVARFCRSAEWAGEELVLATAFALAASGGDDAYHHVTHPGPLVDQRGLFALEASEWVLDPGINLFHPQHNADAARATWVVEGESWAWHPIYRARGWLDQLEVAAWGVANIERPQSGHHPWSARVVELLGTVRSVGAEARARTVEGTARLLRPWAR
jgi:hypothetical protein